ncbi:hypothetical protein [Treponema bryantii]|uniref:hypothetical protein n=1 Tax=Treponema bryantii TaxID=163 RepID=UPI0030C7AD01
MGLIVVAAMLFVGCSPSTGNNNGNGGNNGNDGKDSADDVVNDSSSKTVDFDTALFDENSLTVDVDAIEMSDGTWNYRRIDDYYDWEDRIVKYQLNFSYKNGQIDKTDKGIYNFSITISGTLPNDTSEELKTKLKKLGWLIEENNYSISKYYDKAQLATLSDDCYRFITSISYDDDLYDYYVDFTAENGLRRLLWDVEDSGFDSITDKFKTNADKTQYYWKPHDKEALDKCFLVKK